MYMPDEPNEAVVVPSPQPMCTSRPAGVPVDSRLCCSCPCSLDAVLINAIMLTARDDANKIIIATIQDVFDRAAKINLLKQIPIPACRV